MINDEDETLRTGGARSTSSSTCNRLLRYTAAGRRTPAAPSPVPVHDDGDSHQADKRADEIRVILRRLTLLSRRRLLGDDDAASELRDGDDVRVGRLIGALRISEIRIARLDRRAGSLDVGR